MANKFTGFIQADQILWFAALAILAICCDLLGQAWHRKRANQAAAGGKDKRGRNRAAAEPAFIWRDDGQDLVEYALIVAAVGLAALAVVGTLGAQINGIMQMVVGKLTGVDWSGFGRQP